MELNNETKCLSYLSIDLLQDIDVTTFICEVDGKVKHLPISNKGHYALYLGRFKKCSFEESKIYTVSLQPSDERFEKTIENYKDSLLQNIEIDIEKEDVYTNLSEEHTEKIYAIFKRLLSLLKKAILHQDTELKQWIYKETKKYLELEYHGKTNYQGNWWVYEIGISRCLNEMLILCYLELDKEQICHMMATQNFYIPQPEYEYYRRNYPNVNRLRTNYANLADNIYICLLRSILIQDEKMIGYLASLLPELLKITDSGNGFYPDGSFIYHTNVPYNCAYGEVLLHALVRNLEIFHDLKWNMDQYIDSIYERIYKSYFPFLYHRRALECVRGRSCSRTADGQYSYHRIITALDKLSRIYNKSGYIDKIMNEKEFFNYQPEAFSFHYMNRYIKRNNEYLIAISGCSDAIVNYESINGENLLGSFQGNFIYEIYYNENPKEQEILKINPFYRNGSTNTFHLEEPGKTMPNKLTAGVGYKDILSTCFHQNNEVEGYFSKFVLKNSLVAIGSNIHSNEPYITTLFTFEENYVLKNSSLETDKAKLLFKDKPCIKRFNEERSLHDLNANESEEKKLVSQTRVYYLNPQNYEFQFYPKKACIVDEYQLEVLPNAHILSYQNLILWNSFDSVATRYKEITVQGPASMIFVYKDSSVKVYLTSTPNQNIRIKINGYTSNLEDEVLKILDKLTHCIIFRRKQ